jgi:GT2 family glycosyltransferase
MGVKSVLIVIINFNGEKLLPTCLESIVNNTKYPNYNIAVVDNGSTDRSISFIYERYPMIQVIRNNSNVGFSRANNIAIMSHDSDYYFLLNSDTQVMSGWLEKSISLASSNNQIGIVGSKIYWPSLNPQWLGDRRIPKSGFLAKLLVRFEKSRDVIKESHDIHGCAFLVKREVFDRIGLLDEGFFLYAEESDFCHRARCAGFKIMYNPESQVKHYDHGTAGESSFGYYHRQRSRIRFALLNFSLLRLIIQVWIEIIWIFLAIKGHHLGILIRAYIENVKIIRETWAKRKNRKPYTFRSHALFPVP